MTTTLHNSIRQHVKSILSKQSLTPRNFYHLNHQKINYIAGPSPLRTLTSCTYPNHMKQYQKIETIESPALIIGCGIAGASTALELASRNIPTIVLTSAALPEECNTYYAQGGIIYKGGEKDSSNVLNEDIMIAGNRVNKLDAVNKLSTEGPESIEKLLLSPQVNVPFEKNEKNGELKLTMEASHSYPRIIYKGDHTGQTIATSLLAALRIHPNIQLLSNCTVLELLQNNANTLTKNEISCAGVLFYDKESDKIFRCLSDMTLLATGGIGHLYQQTSNPTGAKGNGIALAHRLGAKTTDMHYVQFHPTTLYTGKHPLGDVANDPLADEKNFLLTEALRGEGGILRNHHGKAFAKSYHPKGELAPRDIVARMILAEMEKEHVPCMYLDVTKFSKEYIKKRFPSIYEHCKSLGMDISEDWIPIVPAAHYHCGGIEVNLQGRTSVPNLYAAGEVACTGLHGANRLASTSLLEGLVWGRSVANDFTINREKNGHTRLTAPCMNEMRKKVVTMIESNAQDENDDVKFMKLQVNKIWNNLRQCMWEKVGPVRRSSLMKRALVDLESYTIETNLLLQNVSLSSSSIDLYKMLLELQNAITTSKLITEQAIDAKQSVGTHYIIDELIEVETIPDEPTEEETITLQKNEIEMEENPKMFA